MRIAAVRPLLFFALAICTLSWFPAWSEESLSGRKACLFPLVELSSAVAAPERAQALSEAVGVELQAAGLQLVPRELWRQKADAMSVSPADLLEGPATIALARESEADVAVSGFFSTEKDTLLISLSFYDVAAGALISGFTATWRFNLGLYNSLHTKMSGLLPRLRLTEKPPTPAVEAAVVTEITFTCSQEGMEVLLAGERSAGRIVDGKLVVSIAGFPPGASLLVEKRMEGYHPSLQTVRVEPRVSLTPLAKVTSLAIQLDWTVGQLLGLGLTVRQYFVPDSLFIAYSFYPYAQSPEQAGGNPVLHFDLETLVGGYLFFPPESPFRLGISAGIGGVFTALTAPGMPVYSDIYLNLANIWVELNLARIAFFLGASAKYALGIGTNILGRRFLTWEYFPPVTIGAVFK